MKKFPFLSKKEEKISLKQKMDKIKIMCLEHYFLIGYFSSR